MDWAWPQQVASGSAHGAVSLPLFCSMPLFLSLFFPLCQRHVSVKAASLCVRDPQHLPSACCSPDSAHTSGGCDASGQPCQACKHTSRARSAQPLRNKANGIGVWSGPTRAQFKVWTERVTLDTYWWLTVNAWLVQEGLMRCLVHSKTLGTMHSKPLWPWWAWGCRHLECYLEVRGNIECKGWTGEGAVKYENAHHQATAESMTKSSWVTHRSPGI